MEIDPVLRVPNRFIPKGDPIWMEYALKELELESGQRSKILGVYLEAVAKINEAEAAAARQVAGILGAGS
jgi:hypothetical protein